MSDSLFEPDEIPIHRPIDPRADAFLRPANETQPASTGSTSSTQSTSEAQAKANTFAANLCEECRESPAKHYLSCYSRSGAHLPNRFICDNCLPSAQAEAKAAGRYDHFHIGIDLGKEGGDHS